MAALSLGVLLWWVMGVQARTEVIFLNVGQGDAILISQGMNQVLIDSGRRKDVLPGSGGICRLGSISKYRDHPDTDHIGGFSGVLGAYQVGQVFLTGAESDTETFRLFQKAIAEHMSGEPLPIFLGTKITFPSGGELVAEYPDAPLPKEAADTNSGSIVARFTYGETSVLLTGDLPHEEAALPHEMPATILKVAHHGSKYSTSDAFLDLVSPQEAVLSVGKNSYGHPAPEVVERLEKRGIRVYRTDRDGDIVYACREQRCEKER
jgi:competence protein ComEC